VEPVVLILVVVVFSILDAIGRKQRQARGGTGSAASTEEADPSESSAQGRLPARASTLVTVPPRGMSVPTAGASEDIIVPELWEEIRKLARTKAGAARTERAESVERLERAVATPAAPVHPVHRTHPKMGRPLSERLTPLAEPADEAARRRPSPEVAEARRMLGQGASALRRAVILDEVLGPPAAMRGDPYEPRG
jgi:hypothetical protein